MIGVENILENSIELIQNVGKEILSLYQQKEIHFELKKDNSPITFADNVSHDILTAQLKKIYNVPIVSEESIIPYESRQNFHHYWLIDPLDGTKDFIAKTDHFSINIALIDNNIPILGLIYAPALDELYYALKGFGSYCLKNKKQKLPFIKSNELIMAKSHFHEGEKMELFEKINKIKHRKRIGSALKFAYLAKGSINLYPRFAGSSEWDIAAGHIIIKEAGCKIIDLKTNKEPIYNTKNMRNNFFIAYSQHLKLSDFILKEML